MSSTFLSGFLCCCQNCWLGDGSGTVFASSSASSSILQTLPSCVGKGSGCSCSGTRSWGKEHPRTSTPCSSAWCRGCCRALHRHPRVRGGPPNLSRTRRSTRRWTRTLGPWCRGTWGPCCFRRAGNLSRRTPP
uniref:Putative secreted protein n=1 Tax=Ixodes ricinus TaxID=34613 RepID=A0A6B0URM5_IXORI